MEYIKKFEKRHGADVGYHNSVIQPVNDEGCVGKRGIDKSYTLEQVVALAYKIKEKPNIIIKGGPNAKWYLKRYATDVIEQEIEKQQIWRDISRCTMWIIEWDV